MKYSEAKEGRIFIIRLEDGEIIHERIEKFALKKKIHSAKVQLLGGVDRGSKLIVGPKEGRAAVLNPMIHILEEMYEATGNGTIFINEEQIPKLHCHMVCGRGKKAVCGEIREGVIVWHVMEVIITELTHADTIRKIDKHTGFELLEPGNNFEYE